MAQIGPTEVHVSGTGGEQVQMTQTRQRVVTEDQVRQIGQIQECVLADVAHVVAVQIEEFQPVQTLKCPEQSQFNSQFSN